jgi:hypothetical protein
MFERIPGSTLKLPIGKSRMRLIKKKNCAVQEGKTYIQKNLGRLLAQSDQGKIQRLQVQSMNVRKTENTLKTSTRTFFYIEN